jgi:hypothetical protein
MAAVSINAITLLLNQQDANGVNVLNRTVGAVSYTGVAGEFEVRSSPDTSQHTLDLPTTQVNQVYIKNTHATGILTIIGTVNGGSSQTLAVLEPGSVFVVWQAVTGKGYTDLKYTADTTGTSFEMYLGG